MSKNGKAKASVLIAAYFSQFNRGDLSSMSKVLLGNISYRILPSKIVIQIPYFVAQSHHGKGSLATHRWSQINDHSATSVVLAEAKVSALVLALTNMLGQCELQFVKLRYPYLDSKILSQYMAINANKYSFTRLQKDLFNKIPTIAMNSVVPTEVPFSWLTGVELELAGRLTTQRNIPRKTVNNTYTGSFTVNDSLGSSLDFYQYATKNKLGAYTVKVWLSNVTSAE